MELKFELDTRLTVSCVVAVALAYGLVTVSIAMDSVLLAFGNTVVLLLILFVLFSGKIDSSNSRVKLLQNEF